MANNIDIKKDAGGSKEISRNPNIADPLAAMDRMVERFLANPFGSLFSDLPTAPRRVVSDIKETDNCYILSAELPGVPKDEIEISVNGNLLSIRAEHKEETQASENQGFRREYRSFQQSFSLPSTVDADKIEAHCENGVLEILLPKTEVAQAKRIEVQSGKGGFLNRLLGKDAQSSSRASTEESKKH